MGGPKQTTILKRLRNRVFDSLLQIRYVFIRNTGRRQATDVELQPCPHNIQAFLNHRFIQLFRTRPVNAAPFVVLKKVQERLRGTELLREIQRIQDDLQV